jgi:GntR family transcriptional regulator/MocR family aminotransferase
VAAIYVRNGPAIRSNFVSIQWAGLGPELLLRLDRTRPQPLLSQLETELREAIRSGRLASGERLPSSRELARELGVSRGLVQECYAQLLAEGYLSARTGSGTRVAAGAAHGAPGAGAAHGAPGPGAAPAPGPVASPSRTPRLDVDFRLGVPDLTSFPRRDWMWALREVSTTAPAQAFGYGDPRGSERLREVLAGYLRRVRGAVADPERIIICAGFQQGFNLVLRVLASAGAGVLGFEDPGHPDDRENAERWGIEPITVAVDEHGVDVDELAASGARGVLLTPAHQSPTGVVLAPNRRRALVEWADANDATMIEDDYDSEFRYDREPVGALQGLAPHRVAMIGTVSKSLSPALRLGWILCPAPLFDAILDHKLKDDRGSPTLDQLALATLIESGRFDRHLRRMRGVYAGRRQALIDALARHAPRVRLQGLAAGIHAVAALPGGAEETDIVSRALERSVGLYPMSSYRADGHTLPPQLALGFGNLTETSIARGIATVSDLLG